MPRERRKFMNASIAIQCLPHVSGNEAVCAIVDKIIEHIDATGMTYFVSPFETTIEGDFDALMDVIKECQLIAVQNGAPSVASYVKIFYNPNGDGLTISEKVDKFHE